MLFKNFSLVCSVTYPVIARVLIGLGHSRYYGKAYRSITTAASHNLNYGQVRSFTWSNRYRNFNIPILDTFNPKSYSVIRSTVSPYAGFGLATSALSSGSNARNAAQAAGSRLLRSQSQRIVRMKNRALDMQQRLRDAKDKGVARAKEEAEKGANNLSSLIRKYGKLAVVTYFGLYFFTLSSMMVLTFNDIIPKGNVESVFEYFGQQEMFAWARGKIEEYIGPYFLKRTEMQGTEEEIHEQLKLKEHRLTDFVNSLVTGWLLTKITEPIRVIATAGLTPLIAKLLRSTPK